MIAPAPRPLQELAPARARRYHSGMLGYAGRVLVVDLTTGRSTETSTAPYAEQFLGGRGIAAKLFWDLVPADAGALDPENCLVCASGPAAGFFGLAGCRWVVCGKSPARQPEAFSFGNLGGKWGSALKYAGYDALAVRGRAERPVILYIHDGEARVLDAADLWGRSTFEAADGVRARLGKGVSVLAIGPAAENGVVFATALADGGASVSGGLGAVMGSKNLKAVAVAGGGRPQAAHPEELQELAAFVKRTRGSTFNAPSPWVVPGVTRPENCYGCGVGCSRQSYRDAAGRRLKYFCQASGVYGKPAMDYYGRQNEVPMAATSLCDGYGLDSAVLAPMISWLTDGCRAGLLTEAQTGLPLSKIGSIEFIQALTRRISLREGFGDLLARGTLAAAEALGELAQQLAGRHVGTLASESRDYDPRLILTAAILLATEPRRPVPELHAISGNTLISWTSWARGQAGAFLSTDDLRTVAERFWGGAQAADFSTYEGKALAAKQVQDRSCAQESLVLCDVHWPMQMTSADDPAGHVGDPALESRLYSAITGKETGPEDLLHAGERIFNLQRAILLRQGWGGRDGDRLLDYFFDRPLGKGDVFFNPDAIAPGPNGQTISRLGATLDRSEFERAKSEYYALRGWDANGIPTDDKLRALGLDEVVGILR